MVSKNLICTCNAMFLSVADNEDHTSECDLWAIDEFWAGYLAWDNDAECLVRTLSYPTDAPDNDAIDWVEDYLEQKDRKASTPTGMSDEDIVLTTDAFIDRMLAKHPVDKEATWAKNSDGHWIKTGDASYSTSTTTPVDSSQNWEKWLTDRHCATAFYLPDQTRVQGTSLSMSYGRKPEDIPDFALYLDSGWKPECMAVMLPWRDYGAPNVSYQFADYAIEEAYTWAKSGAIVEVGCIGAHGRTGTVFACMALLADPELTPEEAIAFIRTAYCDNAIESREQEWYVERFHAAKHGLPEPPKPVYKPLPKTGTVIHPEVGLVPDPKEDSLGPGSQQTKTARPSAGQTGKARRSKRGGKRQHRSNRARQGSLS